MHKLITPLTICLLFSLKSLGQAVKQDETSQPAAEEKTTIISFKVKKTTNGYSITMTNKKIAAGKKKLDVNDLTTLQEGDLLCITTGNTPGNADTTVIKNLLTKRYEYPGDNGIIKSQVVEVDEADFIVRLPYDPNKKQINFETVTAAKKLKRVTALSF